MLRIDIRQDQLREQGAQTGKRRRQRPGLSQNLVVLHPHLFQRHRAAVRLPLADVIPILRNGDARTPGWYCRDQQRSGAGVPRGSNQHFGIECPGTKALLPAELPPVRIRMTHSPLIKRIERIAPEPLAAGSLSNQARHCTGDPNRRTVASIRWWKPNTCPSELSARPSVRTTSNVCRQVAPRPPCVSGY